LGLPARPRLRAYTADHQVWKAPAIRRRLESALLRPRAVPAEAFGREALARAVTGWFERNDSATQVLGALYVYEAYHQDLPGHLRAARTAAAASPAPSPLRTASR